MRFVRARLPQVARYAQRLRRCDSIRHIRNGELECKRRLRHEHDVANLDDDDGNIIHELLRKKKISISSTLNNIVSKNSFYVRHLQTSPA